MRVIGGSARGLTLESPSDDQVRPTLDRVRESLFNILGTSVQDSAFLDLFAGSGANGIEALSRGAAKAVFLDSESEHLKLIQRNLERAKLAERGRTVRGDAVNGLGMIGGPFDYLFADPPRKFNDFIALAESIERHDLATPSSRIIFETASDFIFEETLGRFDRVDTRVYGSTRLTFFA